MASTLFEPYVASTAMNGEPDRGGSEATFNEYFRFLALALLFGSALFLVPLAGVLMLVVTVSAFGLLAGLM